MNLIKVIKRDNIAVEPLIRKIVRDNSNKEGIINGHISAIHI